MMVSLGIYVGSWRRKLRKWMMDQRVHELAQGVACFALGFAASAASLGAYPQPIALALVCAMGSLPAAITAGGAMVGYLLFWGTMGVQCVAWLIPGVLGAVILGDRPIRKAKTILMITLSALIVSMTGLLFQLWRMEPAPVPVYLERVAAAALCTWLFEEAGQRRDPVTDWLLEGIAVLALAQIGLGSWINLGCIAAAAICCAGAFPGAALAGLALDLGRITPVPMTAVMTASFLIRLVPGSRKRLMWGVPAAVFFLVMALRGVWDLHPLPGLILGGAAALLIPQRPKLAHRRGETGVAQVRMELVASVLSQTGQLLEMIEEPPIDEQALVGRAMERACTGCPCRKNCKLAADELPSSLLHKPLGDGGEWSRGCRKPGRLLRELRRSQEQLRAIRADRDRRMEYRWAVVQQYSFLAEYMRSLCDSMTRRREAQTQWYQPEIAVCSSARERTNGDRCFWFAGTEGRYYVLLCDGMGTGEEAAKEGRLNGDILRKLLSAGYPAEYALRLVNSLCALRGRAGAVTVDLCELYLDSGKASIFKWGAAASFVLARGETVPVGKTTLPPGLSVTEGRETVERLSLRRGETLVLLSDGAGGEESLRRAGSFAGEPAGELAARVLACGGSPGQDDATVAVVRLHRASLPVS